MEKFQNIKKEGDRSTPIGKWKTKLFMQEKKKYLSLLLKNIYVKE